MIICEGRKLAEKNVNSIGKKIEGRSLVILQADGNEAESLYVGLKRKLGERLGVRVEVECLVQPEAVLERVKYWNQQAIDGLMVQLPIRGTDKAGTNKILKEIRREIDVDGLNEKSNFVPAAVLAIEEVVKDALVKGAFEFDIFLRVGVVGAKGMVGKKLVERLRGQGYVVAEFDKGDDLKKLVDCGVVISVTGEKGLIKPWMLAEESVCIDLGFPAGDFEAGCKEKASYWTPVPGGVGPVTIACLYLNLLK